MTQLLQWSDADFKTDTINMFKDLQKQMYTISE